MLRDLACKLQRGRSSKPSPPAFRLALLLIAAGAGLVQPAAARQGDGSTMERRDQVLIGRLSLLSTAFSTFFTRCRSTKGPLWSERGTLFSYRSMTRYLRARRKEGFISVIAGFSFIGIMLGVATLIIVMAVMNGFRNQLYEKILGLNGHAIVQPMSGTGPFTNFGDVANNFKREDENTDEYKAAWDELHTLKLNCFITGTGRKHAACFGKAVAGG